MGRQNMLTLDLREVLQALHEDSEEPKEVKTARIVASIKKKVGELMHKENIDTSKDWKCKVFNDQMQAIDSVKGNSESDRKFEGDAIFNIVFLVDDVESLGGGGQGKGLPALQQGVPTYPAGQLHHQGNMLNPQQFPQGAFVNQQPGPGAASKPQSSTGYTPATVDAAMGASALPQFFFSLFD